MSDAHEYALSGEWTGNLGTGTSGYRDYERSVTLRVVGKPEQLVSADRPFRGDAEKWNPEDLLLGALVECHLLSYLHACVTRGVVVTAYTDAADGTVELSGPAGRFTRVTLRPRVTVANADMVERAREAHHDAHEWCFIASSVNFPIAIEPEVIVAA